jgi:hypothetical protein
MWDSDTDIDRGSLDDRFSRKGGINETAARYGNEACVADELDSEFSKRRMVDNITRPQCLPMYLISAATSWLSLSILVLTSCHFLLTE